MRTNQLNLLLFDISFFIGDHINQVFLSYDAIAEVDTLGECVGEIYDSQLVIISRSIAFSNMTNLQAIYDSTHIRIFGPIWEPINFYFLNDKQPGVI